MRVLLLSDAFSSHTIKWANSLAKNGIEIILFSLSDYKEGEYSKEIIIVNMNLSNSIEERSRNSFLKISYLQVIFKLKKYIKYYKPDILHAHYASSYGLLGALSGFHPFIISVWGSDIFEFPKISFLHTAVIRYNLSKADRVLATSNYLKAESQKYTNKEITITPFGIDTNKFKPTNVKRVFSESSIVIGTIKSLEKIYGVDFLIKAFKMVKEELQHIPLKLLIVGTGSEEKNLKNLVQKLNLKNDTIFTGRINHSEISLYHNMVDIFVAFSIEESFGVAVLEASACAKPVIVSNLSGFGEIVDHGKTGIIVEKENLINLSEALKSLIINPDQRKLYGENGRLRAIERYEWNDSLKQMIRIYNSLS